MSAAPVPASRRVCQSPAGAYAAHDPGDRYICRRCGRLDLVGMANALYLAESRLADLERAHRLGHVPAVAGADEVAPFDVLAPLGVLREGVEALQRQVSALVTLVPFLLVYELPPAVAGLVREVLPSSPAAASRLAAMLSDEGEDLPAPDAAPELAPLPDELPPAAAVPDVVPPAGVVPSPSPTSPAQRRVATRARRPLATVGAYGLPVVVPLEDAARLFGLSPTTVRNRIYAGTLGAVGKDGDGRGASFLVRVGDFGGTPEDVPTREARARALVDTGAAAAVLSCHRTTITGAARRGALRPVAVRPSGALLFDLSEVSAYALASDARRPGGDVPMLPGVGGGEE